MVSSWILLACFVLTVCGTARRGQAQQPAADAGSLIPKFEEPVKLEGEFEFTEGPAADAEGNVYFTDIPNSRIYRIDPQRKISLFRENSGRANGLFFDRAGDLIVCEGGNRRVTRVRMSGEVDVLADNYMGKPLNSPNDLWVDPQGGVYFSDPRYGSQDGLEQDGFHVYYIAPGEKSIRRVISDLVKPNGVLGDRDGKVLYVADADDDKTYRYPILGPGKLGKRKLLVEQGSDGMTLDDHGNLYLTRTGVHCFSPTGEPLQEIKTEERPANVCFGGPDFKTLFITARKHVYAAKSSNVAGQRPWPQIKTAAAR